MLQPKIMDVTLIRDGTVMVDLHCQLANSEIPKQLLEFTSPNKCNP